MNIEKRDLKQVMRSYRYGFNGMTKDNEIKGNGNSYDFGARMLDPRIGRWLSGDPLEVKYASLSPYNFVNNNPIKFIDPDGEKIIIVGSWFYRVATMHRLRKLTDDKIRFNRKTKTVYIHKCNSPNKKEYGTNMLQTLIEEPVKVVYIAQKENFSELLNQHYKDNMFMSDEEFNTDPKAQEYSEEAQKMSKDYSSTAPAFSASDFSNGQGVDVSYVSAPLFGSEARKEVINEDGTKGMSNSLAVGHELIHNYLKLFGLLGDKDLVYSQHRIMNPITNKKEGLSLTKHEVDVRILENVLRKENGKVSRVVPYDATEEIELEEMEEIEIK